MGFEPPDRELHRRDPYNATGRARRVPNLPPWTLLASIMLVAGCGTEEIKHYRVAHLEQSQPQSRPRPVAGNRRLLAAIIPHADRTWFFKLMGPTDQVDGETERFDQFVRTIRFGDGREVAWDLPDGWTERGGSESRFATIQVGTADPPIELTVVPLGRESGSLLDNINRWRGQLTLQPISEAELSQITRQITVGNDQVTLVDMVSSAAGPAMPPGHPPVAGTSKGDSPRGRSGIKYTVPDGWREVPSQSAFRVASFEVTSGGQRADVSVSPLSGNAGGLLANINRWRRDQLGLPAIDESELRSTLKRIDVAGVAAHYVELLGAESAAEGRQAILGVILERGSQTWFFKMTGPAAVVTDNRAAFEQFVQSVQFES